MCVFVRLFVTGSHLSRGRAGRGRAARAAVPAIAARDAVAVAVPQPLAAPGRRRAHGGGDRSGRLGAWAAVGGAIYLRTANCRQRSLRTGSGELRSASERRSLNTNCELPHAFFQFWPAQAAAPVSNAAPGRPWGYAVYLRMANCHQCMLRAASAKLFNTVRRNLIVYPSGIQPRPLRSKQPVVCGPWPA